LRHAEKGAPPSFPKLADPQHTRRAVRNVTELRSFETGADTELRRVALVSVAPPSGDVTFLFTDIERRGRPERLGPAVANREHVNVHARIEDAVCTTSRNPRSPCGASKITNSALAQATRRSARRVRARRRRPCARRAPGPRHRRERATPRPARAPSRSKSARKIHRVERTAELDDADALTAPGAFRKGVELADRARVERRHGGGRRGRGRIAGDGGRGGDCRRRSARPRLEAESAVHERRDRRGQPQGAGRLRRVRPSATQSSEHAVPNAAAIAPIGPRIVSERQCRSTTSMPRCAQ